MRRLVAVSLLISAALAAPSGVQELKKLIVSAQTAGESDNKIADKLSHFHLKERLTDRALADIRTLKLGTRTAASLELLADDSEFQPAAADGTAPLTPAAAGALLAKTRAFAVNYIQNLPDFICTSMIRRLESDPLTTVDNQAFLGELRLQDFISTEVSFDHGKESYKATAVNGVPSTGPVPGLTTKGEFGSILGSIMILGGANPVSSRWESVDGKRLAVFRYAVDAAHSRFTVDWLDGKHREKKTVPAFNGELSIDPTSGAIVRLTRHAALPHEARILFVDTVIEYEPVLIGDAQYICPVKSITRSVWKVDPAGFAFSMNEVQFGVYHKFEGESKLAFGDAADPAPPPPAAPPVAPPPVAPAAPVSAPEQNPPPPALNPSDLQNLPLAGGGITLRSTTRMVDIGAVVMDKHGNPVTDLKKTDFQIFDEGKRQTIRLFTPPGAVAPIAPVASDALPEAAAPAAPRVFSNRGEQGSRPSTPTVILFDEGFGKWEEKGFGRDRLMRFLKEQPPGEQIGIYLPIPNGVGIVRELTADAADLAKVIQNWNFGPVSFPSTAMKLDRLAEMNNVKLFDPHYCTAAFSLTAITASADHVAGVAGRKNLIWFSQGLPSGIAMPNCFREEQEALQALNKANMALYAIDFRGLQSVQPDAQIGSKELGCNLGCDSGVTKTVQTMAKVALDTIEQAHQLMLDMAEKTGGRAYIDGNDILGALRAPFTDARGAYALGFYPDSPHADGSYHELTVKLPGRPDLTVRYRRGYVDESSDPKAQLRTALWNPLDSSVIAVSAELAENEVKLTIGVDGLDLQQEGGRWQGKIHVILAQRDAAGQQYDYRDDTVQLDLKPETYEAMQKIGLAYRQVFEPHLKASLLRVLVRDESGDLGSVTIPLSVPQTQLIRR